MTFEASDIPAAAVFTLFTLLLGALLNHRLALARDKKKPVPLSADEEAVLVAAAESGRILIMTTDMEGEWVRAGRTDFAESKDPAVAARFIEAFYRLSARGLVIEEGGAYKLSGSGFQVARALAKR